MRLLVLLLACGDNGGWVATPKDAPAVATPAAFPPRPAAAKLFAGPSASAVVKPPDKDACCGGRDCKPCGCGRPVDPPKALAPPPATVWSMTARDGVVFSHADREFLERWVAARDAEAAMPLVYRPVPPLVYNPAPPVGGRLRLADPRFPGRKSY